MATGWKLTDSNGEVHKSWGSAVKAFCGDETLMFTESWVEMRGIQERDATQEVRERADQLESGAYV